MLLVTDQTNEWKTNHWISSGTDISHMSRRSRDIPSFFFLVFFENAIISFWFFQLVKEFRVCTYMFILDLPHKILFFCLFFTFYFTWKQILSISAYLHCLKILMQQQKRKFNRNEKGYRDLQWKKTTFKKNPRDP